MHFAKMDAPILESDSDVLQITMRPTILLAIAFFSVGCGRQEPTLFQHIGPESITAVVFGAFDDESGRYLTNSAGDVLCSTGTAGIIHWQELPVKEYFRVSDPATVADLWSRLTPVPTGGDPDAPVTFSGVLAHQFFLDSQTNVVATAMVVCNDSQVLAGCRDSFQVHDGSLSLLRTNWPHLVALHRPAYCRSVLDLMWSNAPSEVAWREELYQRIGGSLESQIFVRPEDKQYMRTNEVYQLPETEEADLTERIQTFAETF
jgi:hypothetical protein